MDLKLFSQDSFHLKDWVNNVFNHSEAKDCNDVKQYTSSLVMRLQLAIQEVNNNIEEESSQIVTTLPRVLRDVEALSHEASILKSQMTNVKKEIEEVERNTAASMQTLVELDAVKGRLSASSQALKEADNWTTLSSDIEEVMDSCDIEAISEKLVALQSCLSILAHVPDYEDRVAHLEGLKVRLEALLSPHLVAAFGKHDLEDSTKYAKILSALGRSRNLESYYHKCETQQLLVAWRSGVEGHMMSGQPTWLTNFYEQLSSLITKQMKWCEQVFQDSDPVLLLAELCCTVLTTLDPSASQVVSVALKQQEEPLSFLAALKKAGEDFLHDYQKLVAASSKPALNAVNRNVAEAIFGPLKDQVAHYQDFEESLLLSHLISADVVQGDISESLQLLKNYCSKLLPQTELASERCLQLTSGFAFPALIKAIGTYLENIMERLAQVARHVEQQTTSIQDDWTVFNTCLSLIQTSGEFLMAVDSMEHSLTTTLSTIASRAKEDLSRPPLAFQPASILGHAQIDAFNAMVDSSVENDQRLLERGLTQAQCQCEKSVEVALSTIMAPISCQLVPVANLPAWNSHSGSSSSLSASFSPQEYITQIGQYLLTLPQHLEPLLVNHSPSLNRALQETDLRSGSENRVVSESEVSAADFLISSVSQSTCRLYTDIILRIPEISPNMITQLTTDIDYICNIFEDLGVSSCDPLDKLNLLLKAPAEDYWSVVPGNNPRLVAAVRQIRDIPAKS